MTTKTKERKSSPDMLSWQYKQLLACLGAIQGHSSDWQCPCNQVKLGADGKYNAEYCLGKHLIDFEFLSRETSLMNPANKDILETLADEASEYHEKAKVIYCKGGTWPDLAQWSRDARKKLEPIYYSCSVKKARLQDVDAVLALMKQPKASGNSPIAVTSERRAIVEEGKCVVLTPETNAMATISPSSVENARTDAAKITLGMIQDLQIGENESIEEALRAPKNQSFARKFLSTLPENIQSTLVDKTGYISRDGVHRMAMAIFASAFQGDNGLILAERAFETVDQDIKTISNGIARSLGKLAAMEALTHSGQRDAGLSLADDLAQTVMVYSAIKNNPALTVEKYLAQQQLTSRELTPFREEILKALNKYRRSAKRLGAVLSAYADSVISQPPPGQGGLMALEPVTKEGLWNSAVNKVETAMLEDVNKVIALMKDYDYLVSKLDKCNLASRDASAALNWKPLREFIEKAVGLKKKVQLCSAGLVYGIYQLTVLDVESNDAAVLVPYANKIPYAKRVFSAYKELVYDVIVPKGTPSELIWQPQEVSTAPARREAVEQAALFDNSIQGDLKRSMKDELKAVQDYQRRSKQAEGDPATQAVYGEVIKDELDHYNAFTHRLYELNPKAKLSESRLTYPNGYLIPQEGDKVFQQVAGAFGMPAYIHGIISKGRVVIESGSAIIGTGPAKGKTYPLTPHWIVSNDPEIKRREDERKAKKEVERQEWQNRQKEFERKTKESVEKALREGHQSIASRELKIGDLIIDHTGGKPERLIITEFDEKGFVYARPENELGRAGGSIGDKNNYTLPPDSKEFAASSQARLFEKKSTKPICTPEELKSKEACIIEVAKRIGKSKVNPYAVCSKQIGCRPGREGEMADPELAAVGEALKNVHTIEIAQLSDMFRVDFEVSATKKSHAVKLSGWVDTGGNLSIIPLSIVERLGLEREEGHNLERVFDGTRWGMRPVYSCYTKISDRQTKDLIWALPLPENESVIGVHTLELLAYNVNVAKRKLDPTFARHYSGRAEMSDHKKECGFVACKDNEGALSRGAAACGTENNMSVTVECPPETKACGIVHNHPSGIPVPSRLDMETSDKFNIPVCVKTDKGVNCFESK